MTIGIRIQRGAHQTGVVVSVFFVEKTCGYYTVKATRDAVTHASVDQC